MLTFAIIGLLLAGLLVAPLFGAERPVARHKRTTKIKTGRINPAGKFRFVDRGATSSGSGVLFLSPARVLPDAKRH
jgi:hypothetical protein